MRREIRYIVPSEYDGVSIYDIMRRTLKISAALLRRMKTRKDAILKNGVPAFVTVLVREGDVLHLILEEEQKSENVVLTEGELDIHFENEDVLVVSKPGNMSVHPSYGHYSTSLANVVAWHYQKEGHGFVFRPVNRLDRGTSGLMAIAKNAYAHAFFAEQIKNGYFTREYIAITDGIPKVSCGTIDAPIMRCNDSTIERMVHPDGKRAVTHYETLEEFNGRAIVKLKLETGRTHQIRVHMASIGTPLVGDFLYGKELSNFPRVALHSTSLMTPLPFCDDAIKLSCPMPNDMMRIFYG